jgi:hypothetical protein
MKSKPTFVLVLRPLPGVDGIRALRAALKFLLRRFGLRVITISCAQTRERPGLSYFPEDSRV